RSASALKGAAASAAASCVAGSGGAGASSAGAAPSGAITASFVPTSTVSPSCTRICWTTPVPGLGPSVSTLSVEISSSDSSAATGSPSCLSHFVIVPSETETPICGMTTSIEAVAAISAPSSAEAAKVRLSLLGGALVLGHLANARGDVLDLRDEGLLELRGEGHRWVGGGGPRTG